MDQSKNIIIGLVVIIVIFGGVTWFLNARSTGEGGADKNSMSESAISAINSSYDFGTISMGSGKVANAYEIRNTGTEAINIKKVYTSCMCTQAEIRDSSGGKYGPFGMPGHGGAFPNTNIEIKGGETVFVEAIFDPAAHGPSGVGLAQRSIYLETNSQKSPKVELTFQAMVTR